MKASLVAFRKWLHVVGSGRSRQASHKPFKVIWLLRLRDIFLRILIA